MKFRIRDTGELRELEVITDGQEWTNDLMGNVGALEYNAETEEFELTQDDYEWWAEYIDNYKNDEEDIEELADEIGIDKGEIYKKMQDLIHCDMEDEHGVRQSIIDEIREYSGRSQ